MYHTPAHIVKHFFQARSHLGLQPKTKLAPSVREVTQ